MRRIASGFSLIELVITMVILGVLSAVVFVNFGAKTQHGVIIQADEFRRNLSHIQLLAISQGVRLKLSVVSAGYSVCAASTTTCDPTNPNNAITDPATGDKFNVTLTDATFTVGTGLHYFDTLGRPVVGASAATLVPGTTLFTLAGGGQSASVTVLPVTGFAQAN